MVTVLISAMIFLRKSDEPMGLFVALTLLLFSVTGESAAAAAHPVVRTLLEGLSSTGFIFFITMFFIFPDGSFVPRWTRLYLIGWIGLTLVLFGIGSIYTGVEDESVVGVFYSVTFATPVFAQVYRYARNPNAVQRQQTKWVVVGIAAMGAGVLSVYAIFGRGSTLFYLLGAPIIFMSLSLIPLSIAFSILRYRLWDIDVFVNRALVYGALTVALVGTYLGAVIGLQAVFRAFTDQGSAVAVVMSTLAIAALFQPLRRRIQGFIDRRFYRRKYDAALTLAAFGDRIRDEVDLERLREDLAGLVHETMQPAHVSLWLRESDARSQKSAP